MGDTDVSNHEPPGPLALSCGPRNKSVGVGFQVYVFLDLPLGVGGSYIRGIGDIGTRKIWNSTLE